MRKRNLSIDGMFPPSPAQKQGPLWRTALKGVAAGKVTVASHRAEKGCGESLLSLWSWGQEACCRGEVLPFEHVL